MTNVFAFGKLLTNRELEYGENETFVIFLYTFTINWIATGARNVPIEYIRVTYIHIYEGCPRKS